jgi:hypothetical protein
LIIAKALVDRKCLVSISHKKAKGSTKGVVAPSVPQVIGAACGDRRSLLKQVLVEALKLVNNVHTGVGKAASLHGASG